MKNFRKYLIIIFTLVLTLSMTITVYGASGEKTTYLVTKHKYSDSYFSNAIIIKYDNNGLLNSIRSSRAKGTFVYNKKNQATELRYKDSTDDYCIKYSYDKNGNVKRVRAYMVENGKYDLFHEIRLTWNKKGQLTECKDIFPGADGTNQTVQSYKYNKKGQLTKYVYIDSNNMKTTTTYKYNKEGQCIKGYSDDYYEESTYDGNKRTIIQYKDKSKAEIAKKNTPNL